MFRFINFPVRLVSIALFTLLSVMAAAPAQAADDAVQFGETIHVPKDGTVHDAVCFFCSVKDAGTISGDIVVFFGSVQIEGKANHDVVNFFGEVNVADDASIGHDLVNFFGGVHLGENATVGQDAVVMFGSLQTAESASIGGERVVQPGWIFWFPFLLIFGGISFLVHELRLRRRMRFMRGY